MDVSIIWRKRRFVPAHAGRPMLLLRPFRNASGSCQSSRSALPVHSRTRPVSISSSASCANKIKALHSNCPSAALACHSCQAKVLRRSEPLSRGFAENRQVGSNRNKG